MRGLPYSPSSPGQRATPPHGRALRPTKHRIRGPRPLAADQRLPRRRARPALSQGQVLRLLDAALPLGHPAHGACAQLHHQRRDVPPSAHERLQRADAHGLGRLRPAGRERGTQERRGPGQVDVGQHRVHEAADAAAGPVHRLVARSGHLQPRLLQVEPVAVPAHARKGHRLPQAWHRQLGPGRPDRAGQRAGGRRQGLALGRTGGKARHPDVLPAHHRLRRRAAERSDRAPGGMARAGADDAGQLDRPFGRRALCLRARHP